MNKKGDFWLGTETGKLVVAVACIILALIGLFFVISHLFFHTSDLDLAKASLDKVISDASSGFTQTQVLNPEGWVITSYPQNYQGGDLTSSLCSINKWSSCICICQTSVDNCDKTSTAYCKETDFSVSGFSSYRIISLTGRLPIILQINQDTKTISVK